MANLDNLLPQENLDNLLQITYEYFISWIDAHARNVKLTLNLGEDPKDYLRRHLNRFVMDEILIGTFFGDEIGIMQKRFEPHLERMVDKLMDHPKIVAVVQDHNNN